MTIELGCLNQFKVTKQLVKSFQLIYKIQQLTLYLFWPINQRFGYSLSKLD